MSPTYLRSTYQDPTYLESSGMPDAPSAWTVTTVVAPGPDGPLTFDVETIGPEDAEHTVLALHGFPQSARSWRRVGHLLAVAGIRVIAPDQRGYSPGARPVGVEPYRADRLVGDALAVADAFGRSRFHLLGHDWGAQVGWTLAARHPDRVQSFTALSVPHPAAFARAYKEDPEQREASGYIGLFWQEGKAEAVLAENDYTRLRALINPLPDAEIEVYVERLRQPGALTAALSWYRAMESAGDAAPITVPTTYVWSTADIALRRRGAELCADYVTADYRFVVLDGVSHWIPDEDPGAVAEAVLDRIPHRQ